MTTLRYDSTSHFQQCRIDHMDYKGVSSDDQKSWELSKEIDWLRIFHLVSIGLLVVFLVIAFQFHPL